ncbi:hypothetical protein ACWT_5965 [Actinoplanes sp. SE50]|uniref:hypothetical protein n=1 Tax=unclassified Actinoplanes TaxID=2626549 RepID=UPI00023EC33A|nr:MULTISPECIES: hypothetical protein [unclassified Actinoplanes]AEV86984.1 hypothetical protein ACPL_6097 [Actinoplanes sp. SE50/110]ATO85380.1 hypothetical protein ACWT_5965 [Actinoplanes sp. SE50]SLM02792.1 hypothetical protein ACSP50_6077 [Actinoplanes sp. SE50/110]
MTVHRTTGGPAWTPALPAGRVMCADSTGRALLALSVPPGDRRDDTLSRVPVLGRHGELPDRARRAALTAEAAGEALPVALAGHVDAEAVARWVTGHHRSPRYPAVVLGSPHGAAVHLAAACGAAWLPTSFTVTLPWPGGDPGDWAAARDWGARLAGPILDRNPGVTVRQVHDPVSRGVLCGATVSLQVRWRTLPAAYRSFLTTRGPDGVHLFVRDLRTWPVDGGPPGYSFQIGSPVAGGDPADYRGGDDAFGRLLHRIGAGDWTDPPAGTPRHYAETSGEPGLEAEIRTVAAAGGSAGHRLLYSDPHALSAAVADLHRAWLSPPPGARHALVGTGRMTDPWQAFDAGVVPYWCESSSHAAATAAEWWLAGSRPYDRITVLPDPPGTPHGRLAAPAHWRSIAAFAGRGAVGNLLARRYPTLPAAAGHATDYLRHATTAPGRRPPIPAGEAVRHLSRHRTVPGLMIL